MHNLFRPIILINFNSFSRLLRIISRSLAMDVEMASANWRGVPLSEIIGSQSPWGAPEFPLITPSHNHTVLYHIPSNGHTADRPPKPQRGQDKWDNDHVRMPCSNKSLYPIENSDGETRLKKRWEMIEEALRKPILNSQQLADTIVSYNTKFKTIWKFRSLHALFNDHLDEEVSDYFFRVTLPQIANLALNLPNIIQAPIPLLKQHKNHSISLTQEQIASLLANAFFCTFPRRNTAKRTSEYASYPHINFSPLYECNPTEDDVLEKLTCFCHYFKTVCAKAPRGVATFSRRSVAPRGRSSVAGRSSWPGQSGWSGWSRCRAPLATLPLHVDPDGKIEDAHGLIQLDFANKYLGGGVLGHGCVQEEIRFAICPELMISMLFTEVLRPNEALFMIGKFFRYLGGGVLGHGCVQEEIRFAICPELMISMLFTEVLRPNEALFMIGCARYSEYSGYGRSFRWAGPHTERAPRDSAGRHRVAVLAIDAAPYYRGDTQFRPEMIRRELDKAWVGFSFYTANEALHYPGLATGNWGCGAFGGSPDLKALIQMMAAAEARRPMAYYTFGDTELRDQIIHMYNLLARHNVTVGQLYDYIIKFSGTDARRGHLHSYIQQALLEHRESTEHMDTSASPKLLQHTESPIQRDQHNVSPDLFSQDEDHSQLSNSETGQHSEQPSKTTSKPSGINPSGINTSGIKPSGIQTISKNQTAASSENKMASQTRRLFDELQKFDEDNGKLNLNTSVNDGNVTSRYFDDQKTIEDALKSSDSDLEPNDVCKASSSQENTPKLKICDNKMAASENKMAATTSRLFDEMQKFDDGHGKLKLKVPCSTKLANSKHTPHDSDASVESDRSDAPTEVKRKFTKKITDYFSKKTT